MPELDFSTAWLRLLDQVLTEGRSVAPRGQPTQELAQHTLVVNTRQPVLTVPARRLSYQFMAAEAFWILSGDDSVAGISPYNKRIHEFSDDGKTFFGAYGPKIVGQLPYVVMKLVEDPESRQAGLTIWRECPPATKDVPCTVAIFFNIRDGEVNCHVFMRSSDVWLGVVYDVFNFSMLTHLVVSELRPRGLPVVPGRLYLTAASSHLYARDAAAAAACVSAGRSDRFLQNTTPEALFTEGPGHLLSTLMKLRETKPGDPRRWWEL